MNGKFICITAVLLMNFFVSNAQGSWSYAGPTDGSGAVTAESGRAVCTDASGNVYMCGVFNGTSDFDLSAATTNTFVSSGNDGFISSYDKNGNFRWKVIVTGTSADFSAPSGGICTNGTFVWVAGSANVTVGASSVISSSNTVTLTTSTGGAGTDVMIAKLNCSNGAIQWAQCFGGALGNDFGMGITTDPNGYAYISGSYSGAFTQGAVSAPAPGGSSDWFIAKFTPAGSMLHFNSGGSNANPDAISVGCGLCYVPGVIPSLVATGNTGGASAGTVNFGSFTGITQNGLNDAFLVEMDTALNFTNAMGFGSAAADEILSCAYDSFSGGVFIAGYASGAITLPGTAALSSLGGQDIIFARYSVTANNFVWAKNLGGAANDRGWCVVSDNRGGILLSGHTSSSPCNFGGSVSVSAATQDLYVSRFNASGTPVWAIAAGSTASDDARCIASYLETSPVPVQYLFITGAYQGTTVFGATTLNNDGGSDFFLAKLLDASPPLLPLRWLSISGNLTQQKQPALSWTVNETNVANYEVEESTDGARFLFIASFKSKGDGTNTYQFTGSAGFRGRAWYRVKQIDIDGRYSYSTIISLNNNERKPISVYPNPASDIITITTDNDLLGKTMVLADIKGVIVQKIKITNLSFTISLRNFPAGLYILKADGEELIKITRQ